MKKIFCMLMILALIILPSIGGATQIKSTDYKGDFNFVYPTIHVSTVFVDTAINEKIREEVKNFFDAVKQPDTSISATMSYEIPCDKNNILSIILTEYTYSEGAAHPLTFKRALNFDTRTGKLIGIDNLKKISREYAKADYTTKGITRKLKAYAEREGIYLYSDFKELEKLPENFYFDENFHLHFIFQQYDVAPYAAGIIDLDATI
ncbi:MAG: DUF3298 domain-containing protein [Selenomonadaceae bacterium]|nr:DUF3298 domain-containing protein [Selenomonadaceae bacterium]